MLKYCNNRKVWAPVLIVILALFAFWLNYNREATLSSMANASDTFFIDQQLTEDCLDDNYAIIQIFFYCFLSH